MDVSLLRQIQADLMLSTTIEKSIEIPSVMEVCLEMLCGYYGSNHSRTVHFEAENIGTLSHPSTLSRTLNSSCDMLDISSYLQGTVEEGMRI